MEPVNRHDLQAIGDIARWLTEQADDLSAEQAVELIREAKLARKALDDAIAMLEAQAKKLIEQPILVGHTVWSKAPTMKKRPDQALIATVVVSTSCAPDDNGELPHPRDAAQMAVDKMVALYVSPSTVPKIGGVKALGLRIDDVTIEEHTGFELKQVEIS